MDLDMQFSRYVWFGSFYMNRMNNAGVGPAIASGRLVLQKGQQNNGLKWTRTTDLTLIRRAL